jgi:hypothetical protein
VMRWLHRLNRRQQNTGQIRFDRHFGVVSESVRLKLNSGPTAHLGCMIGSGGRDKGE